MSQDWSHSPVTRAAWFPQPWHGLAYRTQIRTAWLTRASQDHYSIFPVPQCAPRSPKGAGSFTCCRSPPCSFTSHTFTHVGLSCRAVQTQAWKACPMPSCHCSGSLAQGCSTGRLLLSQQGLDKGNLHVSLLLFIAHTWDTQARAWTCRTFPGSEQPCRSPLLLVRRRDRGGDFTDSSGIRLPKQSCGAQDDAQQHQPTTKRICKPGARLS